MSTLARLSILLSLAFLISSCMSTTKSSNYDEGADPYASIGYEDDALLGSIDLKSPVMVAEGAADELEFDIGEGSRAPASQVASNDDLELSLDLEDEEEVTVADVEEALEENEEVLEVAIQEIVEPVRAPASVVRLVPSGTTATIVYTPLWIKIPIGDCVEVVQNRNYENGACIRRRL